MQQNREKITHIHTQSKPFIRIEMKEIENGYIVFKLILK